VLAHPVTKDGRVPPNSENKTLVPTSGLQDLPTQRLDPYPPFPTMLPEAGIGHFVNSGAQGASASTSSKRSYEWWRLVPGSRG